MADVLCAICHQPRGDGVDDPIEALPCAHVFHEECVNNVREATGARFRCPECRAHVEEGLLAGAKALADTTDHAQARNDVDSDLEALVKIDTHEESEGNEVPRLAKVAAPPPHTTSPNAGWGRSAADGARDNRSGQDNSSGCEAAHES